MNKETLVKIIENYIDYYNNKCLQRNLKVLTPMENMKYAYKPYKKLPADNFYWQKKFFIFFTCLLDEAAHILYQFEGL